MSEFQTQYLLSELVQSLGSQADPADLMAILESDTGEQKPLSQTIVQENLRDLTRGEEKQLGEYQKLKDRRVEKLDVFLDLMARIKKDSGLKESIKPKAPVLRYVATGSNGKAPLRVTTDLRVPSNEIDSAAANMTPRNAKEHGTTTELSRLLGLPLWSHDRPYLGNVFRAPLAFQPPQAGAHVPIGQLPIQAQECAILEDLLFLMLGVEGTYIKANKGKSHDIADGDRVNTPKKPEFTVAFMLDNTLNTTLAELVKKITPLCSAYANLVIYIDYYSQFEYGMVNQALCAAIRELLKEYTLLVAQLESQLIEGVLTLQKLWFYIQPSLATIKKIESLAIAADRAITNRGGALLSLLHERYLTYGGDENSRKLYFYFLQRASVPYFAILEKWVFKGIIDDPYKEFMVKEDQKVHKEDLSKDHTTNFWEARYSIPRESSVPTLLAPIKDIILVTGKYLNVIRECGVQVQPPPCRKLTYSHDTRDYEEDIRAVHKYASQTLLNLLLEEKELLLHLRCMKHYFFASQGDYLIHFTDLAKDELKQPVKTISSSKIQSLLELSLKSSVGANNSLTDAVTHSYSATTIIEELLGIIMITESEGRVQRTRACDGFDTFTLDYNAKWPVSIVLNRPTLYSYQLLFRYVFLCRHVERQLCTTWMDEKAAKDSPKGQHGALLRRPFYLRQQMITFIQTIQYYTGFEVLEPNWQRLEEQLATASTLDEVLDYHSDFLQNCLTESMLTEASIVRVLDVILATCVKFVHLMMRSRGNFSHRLNRADPTPLQIGFDAEFDKELAILEGDFRTNFTQFMTTLNDVADRGQYSLSNLVSRLNFSGFYAGAQEPSH